MFAVVVTFEIAPDRLAEFMPLMLENARASRETEPGCQRFDVCTDPERPSDVFLYEIYDDRAAFDAHLGTAHFKAFDAAVAEMIMEKDIRTYMEVAA